MSLKPKTPSDTSNQDWDPCKYHTHSCTRPRVAGRSYCLRHILEDKSSPFKQCNFVYPSNGKKCMQAARKIDKKDYYCTEHEKKVAKQRTRTNARLKPPATPQVLLSTLQHYVPASTSQSNGSTKKDNHSLDPFVDINASKINTRNSQVLDYASETDSEAESLTLDDTWIDDDWEGEAMDSEGEDYLKYAGTFTTEEVVSLSRQKLIRLQSLYIDQLKRLQHLLLEKRTKYLKSVQADSSASIGSYLQMPIKTPTDRRAYVKFRALAEYGRRSGMNAALSQQAFEKRAQLTEHTRYKTRFTQKCIYTEGGVRCSEKGVPLSKYCFKHILMDREQVLFHACGHVSGDIVCAEPYPQLPGDELCVLHRTLEHPTILEQDEKEGTNPEPLDSAALTSVPLAMPEIETKCDTEDTGLQPPADAQLSASEQDSQLHSEMMPPPLLVRVPRTRRASSLDKGT